MLKRGDIYLLQLIADAPRPSFYLSLLCIQPNSMSDFSSKRLLGLDIVRGSAIIAVLFAHGRYLLNVPDDYLFLTVTGKFAVELFFVLSGFLIGSILIKAIERSLSFKSLSIFWTRRWLRTLPAYFAVLLFVWAVLGKFHPLYFLFLQDLVLGNWDILPVSWTLVIEEWFYLLFPPSCFILMLFVPRYGFIIAAIFLIFSSTIFGYGDFSHCSMSNDPLGCFENDIRKFTFRFTSIGMGTLMAYAHNRRDLRTWLKPYLKTLQMLTLLITLTVLAFCADVILNFPGNVVPVPVAFALFYPLMGIASVLVTTLLYVWEPRLPSPLAAFFSYASITSYSCYLWHLMIIDFIRILLAGWNQILLLAIALIASLAAGGISYLLIERPFLTLRDHIGNTRKVKAVWWLRTLRGQEHR